MALIATARNASEIQAALDAEADAVMVEAASASEAASAMDGLATEKLAIGAIVPSLSTSDAETLRQAKCDFVVSTLDGTDSAAVDTEKAGQVVVAGEEMEDNTLRALGPLGLDGLYVRLASGSMTLGQRLGLVRLATFAATGLLVTVNEDAKAAGLRVLRDSGVLAVVAPAGASPEALKALSNELKAVPPSKKARHEGGDMAIVPAGHPAAEEDDGEEEDE
jgi:hypothetical protein